VDCVTWAFWLIPIQAVVLSSFGAWFLFRPAHARQTLWPDWRELMKRWPLNGLGLTNMRVVGAGFIGTAAVVTYFFVSRVLSPC
jgi:hypothetical protein